MENRANYIMVGLFVLVFSALTVALGVWIAAYKNQKEYVNYAVYFQEAVSGLSAQSIVKFNGVPVGFVNRIELDPKNIKNVRMLLSIERQVPINVTTSATLKAQGLTGITYVELSAKSNSTELLKAQYGQPYPVIPSTPSLLLQLDTTLREVTQNLKKMADSFQNVLDKENVRSIKTSLDGIAKVTSAVARHSTKLERALTNLDKVMVRTEKLSNDFPEMNKRLQKSLIGLQKLTNQFSQAGTEANKLFRQTQITVSMIASQLMPNLNQALVGFSSVTQDLQQITAQVKYDPSILLRGRKHASAND